MFISMPSLAYLFLFILTHSQKCNVWTILNLHVEIHQNSSRLYQLTNEICFCLYHTCMYINISLECSVNLDLKPTLVKCPVQHHECGKVFHRTEEWQILTVHMGGSLE